MNFAKFIIIISKNNYYIAFSFPLHFCGQDNSCKLIDALLLYKQILLRVSIFVACTCSWDLGFGYVIFSSLSLYFRNLSLSGGGGSSSCGGLVVGN